MKGSVPARRFEQRLGRLLIVVTWIAVVLLGIGVVLMLARAISPLDGGPRFDPARLLSDLSTLEPAGFLWLGLLAVLGTPISRVVGAAIGFARRGERAMTLVAVTILVVIAVGLLAALGTA